MPLFVITVSDVSNDAGVVDAPGHGELHSIFPLLMRLIAPDSEELGKQLADPGLLWTPYGLR